MQYFESKSRGQFRNSWLNSQHTFSFGEYHDANRMGFRALRVINEDRVDPSGGFAPHGHKDMEIITYVMSGALGHKDSLGNGSTIRPGEIQRMSAGSGIRHSEMNVSDDDPVHFLQIWVQPDATGHAPSYEQIELLEDAGSQGFTPIATPDGGEGAISLNQNAVLSIGKPNVGETINVNLGAGRYGFLHVVKGDIEIDGKSYRTGDALAFDGSDNPIELTALQSSEVLLFDLA
jgi:redox-sensitive bicupin YhaK (pirin superfamily)